MSVKRTAPAVSLTKLRPLFSPVVKPVLERLERNEQLLLDMKAAMEVQFKRTAEIQAQLDVLVARFAKQRK